MFHRLRSTKRRDIGRRLRRCLGRRRLRTELLESRRLLATLNVTTDIDALDLDPGDGVCEIAGGGCSLRAAVQEANSLTAGGAPHRINVPAGLYELTIDGTDESEAQSGDLDIRRSLELVGSGAGETIIEGGGIDRVFDVALGTVVVQGVTIRGGFVEAQDDAFDFFGGGIRNEANLTLVDSVVTGNRAVSGAGIANYNASLRIERSVITGNGGTTTARGGGVLNYAYYDPANLDIVESTVAGNQATSGGGVLNYALDGVANTTIQSSTISGNSATRGAGVSNLSIAAAYPGSVGANVSIRNSTLSGNSASSSGGGLRNQTNEGGSAVADILNSTITANAAVALDGGGIESVDSTETSTEIRSTIVAGNSAGREGNDLFGETVIGSFSLVGDSDGHSLINGDDNNLVGFDPMLGPLEDNGGPTLTHTLQSGSPAIDQGSNSLPLENDQRSIAFLRSVDDPTITNALDGTDIGAVEVGQIAAIFDFGDAPDGIAVDGLPRLYPTLAAHEGARHRIDRFGPFLGRIRPDAENDGQTTEQAAGDDLLGDDDEDSFSDGPLVLSPGEPIRDVVIQHDGAGDTALLSVWLDLNLDGDWDDVNEQLIVDRVVPAGASQTSLSGITLPSDAIRGTSFFRARISTEAGLGPAGEALDGEVEDVRAVIGDAPIETADLSLTHVVDNQNPVLGEMVTFTITVSNDGPDRATNVEVTNLLPDEMFFEQASVSQGTYEFEETWFVDTLEPGASAVLQILATVDSTDSFTHTAEITYSDQFDPNSTPGNGASGEDDQASVTLGTCLSGGPLHVGQNRVFFHCATPGGFVGFVHGTERGEQLIEAYNVTVDIADADGAAIAIADLQGIASAHIDITKEQLIDAVAASGKPLLVQAFEMFPARTKSNTLSINTELQMLQTRSLGDGAERLDARLIQSVKVAALERWSRLPLSTDDTQTLRSAHIVISDLPGTALARVVGRTIVLDGDAAGHGWFVDPTPFDDGEYAIDVSRNGLNAIDATAAGRIDLLTTLMHEYGHLLRLADVIDTNNVMHRQLDLGVRRLPASNTGPRGPLDVNGDGQVSAIDALLVVNWLGRHTLANDGLGPLWVNGEAGEALYLDCTGDFRVSARDALIIINHLGREGLDGEQIDKVMVPRHATTDVFSEGAVYSDELVFVAQGPTKIGSTASPVDASRESATPRLDLEQRRSYVDQVDAAIEEISGSLETFPQDLLSSNSWRSVVNSGAQRLG